MREESRERKRPPTGGPACIPGGNDGHEVNRRPEVGAVYLQPLKTQWPNGANKKYRGKNKNQKLIESPGNEQRSERGGQPLGPPEIKAPLTLAWARRHQPWPLAFLFRLGMPCQSWLSYILYHPEGCLFYSNRSWQGTGRGHCPCAVVGFVILQMSAGGKAFSQRRKGGHYGFLDSPRPSITVPSRNRPSVFSRPHPPFRETGVGWPIGRRSISVQLGLADPLALPAVFCAPNGGNS